MSSGIMKAHTLIASIGLQSVIIVIIVVSLVASPVSSVNIQKSRFPTNSQPWNSSNSTRRILHQPLFPASSSPPPDTDTDNTDTSPPPSPPSPSSTYNPDQPFFPEVPTTPTPDDQISSPPPPPPPISQSSNGEASVPIPTATQPTKPTKKVAIALSVGIVTLGMLSGLAFYLYKHRQKQTGDTHKLVGDGNRSYNSDESRGAPPPSSFLYIGTVEPSSQRSIDETNDNIANGSPYHKLNTAKKMTDRYRPSPDLQPLPPLNRAVAPAPPPNARSPPPPTATTGSSSDGDDEGSLESAFYTPQGSIASYDDAFSTPASRHSHRSNGSSLNSSSRGENHGGAPPPVPYSKRTSPRSRPSASSPDVVKHAIIPSIKTAQPPRPSEENSNAPETRSRLPRRTNFPPLPPAPPNLALHSISNQSSLRPPKFAAPPPPPPPPPPPGSMPRKTATHIPNISSVAPHSATLKSQSQASDFQLNNPSTEKPEALKDVDDGCSSSTGPDDDDDMAGSRPKLKALHWDKVRATSDRATVWDQLNSSSFQLNEEMMTSLFGNNSNKNVNNNSVQGQVGRRSVLPPVEQQNRVLDPKKSQNIAILLRALNVTRDEVSEALLDGNPEGLGPELLETLVKMAPTKEEEIKLKDYKGDVSKLGSAERFLKAILDIPFAFHRVEAMLYRANFDAEVKYLRKSYDTLEAACGELKNSRLFFKLLEAVLSTGNRMNVGTNRGGAKAFKLDTLLKLADVKGTDGKTTLLHFVVQEIIRSEVIDNTDTTVLEDQTNNSRGGGEQTFKRQGLQVVSGLGRELCNVKLAAGMDSEVLNNYVLKLEMGLEKVRSVLQRERRPEELPGGRRFFDSMKAFLKEAEQGISKIKDEERKALILVREVTEYFHGNATKEEAHPFRIFMIVRDFLSILDHVCKDVGKMQERTVMGAARSFRISANAPLPVHNRYNARREVSSDEESSSP